MFWMGLIIGLFIGANVGLIVLSLLFASQKGNCGCQSYDSKFSEGPICCI
jgi:gas vesicle protein